jgi:hypothetical protein
VRRWLEQHALLADAAANYDDPLARLEEQVSLCRYQFPLSVTKDTGG